MVENYSFSMFDENASGKLKETVKAYIKGRPFVVLCIGSVKVTGDSFAPLAGTMLKGMGYKGFVYGTVKKPLTAREITAFSKNIKEIHPDSVIIAIDSAVGDKDEVGEIKFANIPLRPGLAIRKDLKGIGDCSVLAVVSGREENNLKALEKTAFFTVSKMAEVVANAIANL